MQVPSREGSIATKAQGDVGNGSRGIPGNGSTELGKAFLGETESGI